MPTGIFLLGAEVDNPTAGVIPEFVSRHSRNRHDRADMHYGTFDATLIELSGDIGATPAGATVEDALRAIMALIIDAESILGSRFTLDAYSDESVFWRDTFARIVAAGLGTSTSRSTFGTFPWQRYDVGTSMAVDVDGAEAQFTGSTSSQTAEFIGYPTYTEGEFRFDVFVPLEDATGWLIKFQPWRDDITDVACFMRLRHILSAWFLDVGFMASDESTILTATTSAVEGWFTGKFQLVAPGGTIAAEIWQTGATEPAYSHTGTLPASATGFRWIALGASGKQTVSNDALAWTESVISGMSGENFVDVCYGPAFGVPTWMAVGSVLGEIWSRDLATWTQVTTAHTPSGTLPSFGTCATDGAGTWIACNQAQTTPWRAIGDPATSFWNRQTTSLAHAIFNVRWGNDRFVAVTQFGEIATSPDGGTWTNRTSGLNTSLDFLQDAAYGNGTHVVMGGGGAGANEFKTSTSSDGSTWTAHTVASLIDHYGFGLAFGNGKFVVVGTDNFTAGFVATSSDGVTWVTNAQVFTDNLNDVAYVDGIWVAVGDNGSLYEASDPDSTWTAQTSGFGADTLFTILGRPVVDSRPAPVFHVASSADVSFRTLLVDNMKGQKTDADPVRIYHVFRLDAYVGTPSTTFTQTFTLNAIAKARRSSSFTLDGIVKTSRSSSFTLNAIVRATKTGSATLDAWVNAAGSGAFTLNAVVRATVSGSFTLNSIVKVAGSGSLTLDAWVKATRSSSFTLDSIVKSTRSSSFTLDAYVGGESGLLGDHVLAQHKLGGE